jgi:hypothetical protein
VKERERMVEKPAISNSFGLKINARSLCSYRQFMVFSNEVIQCVDRSVDGCLRTYDIRMGRLLTDNIHRMSVVPPGFVLSTAGGGFPFIRCYSLLFALL